MPSGQFQTLSGSAASAPASPSARPARVVPLKVAALVHAAVSCISTRRTPFKGREERVLLELSKICVIVSRNLWISKDIFH